MFETLFFRGLDVFYGMFVIPPSEWYDHMIFAWVRNLAGDDSCMAIGTDFELNRMSIVFSPVEDTSPWTVGILSGFSLIS